ncbi:acyltransferase family protein [Aurantiacibacter sp. MUD61]|uniref:acyltransferase family protein n=1 Tax=Aurantiacibacter sp. MUD61 TaxID=3009083 RepID=UPI0022F06386|nr:acyltransferase [Aurantiacibacter sp. MUD61]
MEGQTKQYFQTLDALRGVAALAVMVFHAPTLGGRFVPSGYLAVDLFFMLSGVVIAQAYHRRMADGLAIRSFLYRRFTRLWPMLALGAALGILLHQGHAGSLLLLPNWKSELNLYPSNPPMWSLLMEALAYLAFACGLWRAGPRVLAAIALASGAILAVQILTSPSLFFEFGAHWMTLGGGLARVAFGFSTGMLLWHIWRRTGATRTPSQGGWLAIAAALIVMALVPLDEGLTALAVLFLVFPAIIWWALTREIPQTRAARALGDLSYPLYCIHMPILVAFAPEQEKALLFCLVLPSIALACARMVDAPVRRFLSTKLPEIGRSNSAPVYLTARTRKRG